MQEQKVTIDGGKSNITINIVINGVDSTSAGAPKAGNCDEEIVAAIAAALDLWNGDSEEDTAVHDTEVCTVLISPTDRIYSPWASKALTFRQIPLVRK